MLDTIFANQCRFLLTSCMDLFGNLFESMTPIHAEGTYCARMRVSLVKGLASPLGASSSVSASIRDLKFRVIQNSHEARRSVERRVALRSQHIRRRGTPTACAAHCVFR